MKKTKDMKKWKTSSLDECFCTSVPRSSCCRLFALPSGGVTSEARSTSPSSRAQATTRGMALHVAQASSKMLKLCVRNVLLIHRGTQGMNSTSACIEPVFWLQAFEGNYQTHPIDTGSLPSIAQLTLCSSMSWSSRRDCDGFARSCRTKT